MKPLAPIAWQAEDSDNRIGVSGAGSFWVVTSPIDLAKAINEAHAAVVEPLLAKLSALREAAANAVYEAVAHEGRGLPIRMHELRDLLNRWDHSLPPYVPAARLEEAQRVLADALEATGVDKLKAENAELRVAIENAANIAENYGRSRPPPRGRQYEDRHLGELAASAGIARLLRDRERGPNAFRREYLATWVTDRRCPHCNDWPMNPPGPCPECGVDHYRDDDGNLHSHIYSDPNSDPSRRR